MHYKEESNGWQSIEFSWVLSDSIGFYRVLSDYIPCRLDWRCCDCTSLIGGMGASVAVCSPPGVKPTRAVNAIRVDLHVGTFGSDVLDPHYL